MNRHEIELENFKTQIDLVSFAQRYGYEVDTRKTSRTSISMKHPANGDRIIIGIGNKKNFFYTSVHNSQDQGTIIDFCQYREGGTLGDVRKQLRPLLAGSGSYVLPRSNYTKKMEPVELDLEAIQKAYANTKAIEEGNSYLTQVRHIPVEIYTHDKFKGRVRTDARSNVIFPHWESKGVLTGWEIKNEGFTGFAKHGAKRLFASGFSKDDTQLIIGETGIDILSYAALFGIAHNRFLSTAGTLNPHQPPLLRSAMANLPPGGCVVSATDADEGGDQLNEQLEAIFSNLKRADIEFKRHSPEVSGEDWNGVIGLDA